MFTRNAKATWKGDLKTGNGVMNLPSVDWAGPYTFASRFESGEGTNPEELIAAAHAGCFSMAFSNMLAQQGHTPTRVSTTATAHFDTEQKKITKMTLDTEGEVPGIDEATFKKIAEDAKAGCPISKTLSNLEIVLNAKLVQS